MHSQLSLLHCQLHVPWGQMVHYTIHITFSVPHVTEVGNDGQIYSSLMPLEVNSISLATGYGTGDWMRISLSILVKICVSSLPEGNGLTSLCLFLHLYLLSQLLWVQTHSSSGPCKQPTIWLQTSYGHKAQTLVLSTGRSRWSTSLTMWKVAIKSARYAIRSCLLLRS